MITNFSDLAMGGQGRVNKGSQPFVKAAQLSCVGENFSKATLGIGFATSIQQGFDAFGSLSRGGSHI